MDYSSGQGRKQKETKDFQPEEKRIPVIEEQVKVEKETKETGSVHIYKHVTEKEVEVDVPVVNEELEVERVEVNQFVDEPPPAIRNEGNTTVISVLKEVVVKRTVLVEEVRVTRKKTTSANQQKVTLRKEEVEVERGKNKGNKN
ncbi:DUF2382 domain-containing protein [Cytophagaceae bacterium ABcell3]|nr:DUF2382 domain-containing protein [Cytophagaceae bacterium ABcell3]